MGIVAGSISAYVLVLALSAAGQQGAAVQPSPGAQPTAPAEAAAGQSAPAGAQPELPVSLDKIQRALSRPAAIRPVSERNVFRVEVIARKPTITEILGPDYLIGPVPYGGMTHQEFLNMVTPTEYRGYSAFTNKEGFTVAATSLALQWAMMKAIDKLKDARDERAKEAARKEVLAAMNELEAARKKAREREARDR